MESLDYYPTFFGSLDGTSQPYYGSGTFTNVLASFTTDGEIRYAYEFYKLIRFVSPVNGKSYDVWVPEQMNNEEAINQAALLLSDNSYMSDVGSN